MQTKFKEKTTMMAHTPCELRLTVLPIFTHDSKGIGHLPTKIQNEYIGFTETRRNLKSLRSTSQGITL